MEASPPSDDPDARPEPVARPRTHTLSAAGAIGLGVAALVYTGLGTLGSRGTSRAGHASVATVTSATLAPSIVRTLAGVEIRDASPRTIEAVRAALARYVRASIVVEIEGVRRTTPRAALGLRVDDERLTALVADATAHPTSALATSTLPTSRALPLPVTVDGAAAIALLLAWKDDVDRPARDARLDLDDRKVVAEQPGVRLEVFATFAALDRALRAGDDSVRAATAVVAPTLTHESLRGVEMTDVLGYFETKYATDQKHVDRTFNLRLAASKLNGKVLMPGETFDFNDVVGPRDEAHGYRVAKVIADGELVDGMGGGTCQIAGTLHGASFFAGLEIVQRTPHTRPSYYIKMGLDAAVAYPSINLKLRNPFAFPIVFRESVAGGTVRAEILGPKRTRVVTLVRKIDEILPFSEREVRDERLPEGTRLMSQRGIPGFKVRRYRVVREGTNAVRERSIDTYPSTTQIWRVGVGDKRTTSRPSADDHPEYVADELLTITQGPGIGHPDTADRGEPSEGASAGAAGAAGMEESREPGRSGVRGWSRHFSVGAVHAADPREASSDDPHAIDAPVRRSIARRKHH